MNTVAGKAPPISVPVAGAEMSPGEAQRLAEAFRIFNQASEELTTAYSELQGQVGQLTQELAAANGALRQQYQEKAALTERLTVLLNALPAGVMVLDGDGVVVQTNPAATHLLGQAKVGAGWTAIEAALVASETPGEYLAGERRLAMAVTPLDTAGGRIVLLHDVTETQVLKTRAERNQRLAAMGEMAAQLAHQLRTPLAAALLYAGNLENPKIAAASRVSIAQKTVARLKHLERLIQDMLLFARGEVLGREHFVVADLIAELAQTFEPLARQQGVSLIVGDIPLTSRLTGNRKSLAGALTNLLENALDAAAQVDSGRVTLEARHADENCEMLALIVRDNGRGMDADTVARLFEPFFTTRAEGTGLGLAIARGVARAHGGSIELVSSPGAGAEFVLTLPTSMHVADDATDTPTEPPCPNP
jgi:two-component system sensor histidine kinase FlrB